MVLEKIRSATAAHHQQLEASPLLKHINDRTITMPVYIELLNKFYGYFQPVELALNRYNEISAYLPDYHQRRKAVTLAEDLRKLSGLSAAQGPCSDLPMINNAGKAFGCLYVMEGSTLGGRIISSVLKDRLNIDHLSGASFFYGYGAETGPKWKAFNESLSLFSSKYNNDDDIVQGAADTFEKLGRWMNS